MELIKRLFCEVIFGPILPADHDQIFLNALEGAALNLADPSTSPSPRYFGTLPRRVRSRVGVRAETAKGDHQKWTAITLGGPAIPDITLAERTTCMFLLDQSLCAFFTASAKYA